MARPTDDHPLIYLDSRDAVARFTDELRGVSELAIDTEGASFHRFVDRIYLLQLSTRERSAIIDPLPIGKPEGLGELVESPAVEKVFHDADYDLRLLHQDYGWQVRNVFDTRIAAQLIGLKAFGLAALLERYFEVKLDKKHQRADWSQRPLSQGMIDYAATDTRWLLDLRDRLQGELERLGRLHWAREEFQRLEAVRWDEQDEENAFMRMKGARDLNRRELAVLGEVVRWRDQVAGDLDRATFRVISNEALFEIARQQPRSTEALGRIKGMPRGILESRGRAVLEAVAAGLAIPDASLPRFARAARWDRDPDFDDRAARLKVVRDAAAHRLELDPGVLCSRDRLELVARRNPETVEELETIDGLRRWQVEVLGEDFLKALRAAPATKRSAAAPGRQPAASPAAASNGQPVGSAEQQGSAEPSQESPYRDP